MVELFSHPTVSLLEVITTPDEQTIEIIKTVAPSLTEILPEFKLEGTDFEIFYAEQIFFAEYQQVVCRKMFELWLEGKGRKPVSWVTLLEILEKTSFQWLAHEVKSALTYEFQCMRLQVITQSLILYMHNYYKCKNHSNE